MSITVCLASVDAERAFFNREVGGHFWVFLNWALGLRANGCQVIWLEGVSSDTSELQIEALVEALKRNLEPYNFANSVALFHKSGLPLPATTGCLDLEEAASADLLLNLNYWTPPFVVECFRRSALVDIDPGLAQIWMGTGQIKVAPHDVYFTIGETVGQPGARFPDCGVRWHYTPPLVYLPEWPMRAADPGSPFTTVTGWWGEWVVFQGQSYENSKRSGFMPFLDLPRHTHQPLELAISLGPGDEVESRSLSERGWRVRQAQMVSATPEQYRRYIQKSRGEFSCAKPSCVRLQNAWISDRTLCYLASGKPAIVQHTGKSRFLPDDAGLFRFRNLVEAGNFLEIVARDYERQCNLARALAKEYFDATKVIGNVLQRALP
jgi:hypothetical protein